MELVKLSGDEWRTLVVIPAAISLAVNLLTPLTQRAATALIVKAAGGMRGGLAGLLRIRVHQINDELAEIRELRSNNTALLKHYQSTITYLNFGLLTLFLSPVIGIIFESLATKYTHLLPEFYRIFTQTKGVVFVLVVASLYASGPFQALIYSSSVKRKIKHIIKNPDALIEKLETERANIEDMLSTKSSNDEQSGK